MGGNTNFGNVASDPSRQVGYGATGKPVSDENLYSHPLFGNIRYARYTNVSEPSGALQAPFQGSADTRALELLRAQSTSGETPWLRSALEQSKLREMYGRQDLAKRNSRALRTPRSSQQALNAMRGVGGTQQQFIGQAMQSPYQLMSQANAQSAQRLMGQAGREIQALQPQDFNINQAMTERRLADESNFANYSEAMRSFAARQQAQAQLDAGGKAGLLGFLGL